MESTLCDWLAHVFSRAPTPSKGKPCSLDAALEEHAMRMKILDKTSDVIMRHYMVQHTGLFNSFRSFFKWHSDRWLDVLSPSEEEVRSYCMLEEEKQSPVDIKFV